MVASLEAIEQGEEETLRAYIERFSSEATMVTAGDNMKSYLLERGLRRPSELARSIGIQPPTSFNELLERANTYIKYEEKEALARKQTSSRFGSEAHLSAPAINPEEAIGSKKTAPAKKLRDHQADSPTTPR
jgi:hypothetical protein